MKLFSRIIMGTSVFMANLSLHAITQDELVSKLSALSTYQDVVINGEVVVTGWGPSCAERYQFIKDNVLSQYYRPFTILDLGADQGYFALRAAADFDCTVVMIEPSDDLTNICALNTDLTNIVFLNIGITPASLKELVAHEHFDIVLVQNFLHHQSNWQEYTNFIYDIADNVVVDTPEPGDLVETIFPESPNVINYLKNQEGYIKLGQTRRYDDDDLNTTFWWAQTRDTFNKQTWSQKDINENEIGLVPYTIISSFTEKFIKDEEGNKITYDTGITLSGFQKYCGDFPLYEDIKLGRENAKSGCGNAYKSNLLIKGKKGVTVLNKNATSAIEVEEDSDDLKNKNRILKRNKRDHDKKREHSDNRDNDQNNRDHDN